MVQTNESAEKRVLKSPENKKNIKLVEYKSSSKEYNPMKINRKEKLQ